MSGDDESGISVRTDVHALVVRGASRDDATGRKRIERAALDVKGILVAMRDDDGVPVLALPAQGGDGAGASPGRAEVVEGQREGRSWRLEVAVGRALTVGERDALGRGVEQLLWPPLPPVRRVHHLSCLTMCPLGGRLWNEHGKLVCHCLLVETAEGLVLVDTGLGVAAFADLRRFSGPAFRGVYRPVHEPDASAVRQVERLGYAVDDVRHIVLTHLDVDHAGGLADFPNATVHVSADERRAAEEPRTFFERQRYVPAQWAHDVRWQLHEVKGERWYGFPCVRDLPGLPPEILLVPLVGHTRGHCGVAVDVGGRWLLHCGDAYFHKDEMDAADPWCPAALRLHQRLMAVDDVARRRNQARLRELQRGVGDGVTVLCAHDPDDLARLRQG